MTEKYLQKKSSNRSVNPERFHVDLYTAPVAGFSKNSKFLRNFVFIIYGKIMNQNHETFCWNQERKRQILDKRWFDHFAGTKRKEEELKLAKMSNYLQSSWGQTRAWNLHLRRSKFKIATYLALELGWNVASETQQSYCQA